MAYREGLILPDDDPIESATRDGLADPPETGDARRRLALTRVLIWAEHEAAEMERSDVSATLKDAIALLHRGG